MSEEEIYDSLYSTQSEDWEYRNKKYYWRVRMLNGGYKVVYLTEEKVREFYEYDDYVPCFGMKPIKRHYAPEKIG